MDKTANYNLPQWVETDPIRMKPFNDAFDEESIDVDLDDVVLGNGSAGGDLGDDVDVELEVALVYPQPVREAAQRLRTAVASDVHRLTGWRVRRVAVTVVGLLPDLTSRVD